MGQKRGCDLAFFSVVASSPNLSTFYTPQKYGNIFEWQNKVFRKLFFLQKLFHGFPVKFLPAVF